MVCPLVSDCRYGAQNIMIGLTSHRNLGSRVFVQATSQGLVKCHEVLIAYGHLENVKISLDSVDPLGLQVREELKPQAIATTSVAAPSPQSPAAVPATTPPNPQVVRTRLPAAPAPPSAVTVRTTVRSGRAQFTRAARRLVTVEGPSDQSRCHPIPERRTHILGKPAYVLLRGYSLSNSWDYSARATNERGSWAASASS
jgi:hypothetical protein